MLRMFELIFFNFYRFALSSKKAVSIGLMSKWCHMPLKAMSGLGLITGKALTSR